MDPKNIEKLANVLRDQGDKILTADFKFTLTGEQNAPDQQVGEWRNQFCSDFQATC
jgi:hypothetical protein